MDQDVVVVVATHPDEQGAAELARTLVGERLAACVQLLPGLRSTYRWGGAVETAVEVRIEVKTTAGRLGALRKRFRELHPHEVPELVVLAAAGGLGSYLDWVRESTTAEA